MYERYIKRSFDIIIATISLILFSPLILILAIIGFFKMKGNPFFTQERPGLNEKIFKLIKFKSMTNEKGEDGRLLPDAKRLTAYGKFIRNTSLDELPELINIIRGDMSIVGPRPLLVKYLTRYNSTERRRHEVRPGLTGLAQVNGRNKLAWSERFRLDVEYVDNISFLLDIKIILLTILKVIKRDGISSETSETMEEFMGDAITDKDESK